MDFHVTNVTNVTNSHVTRLPNRIKMLPYYQIVYHYTVIRISKDGTAQSKFIE